MKRQGRPAISFIVSLVMMILLSALLCGCSLNNSKNPIDNIENRQMAEGLEMTDPLTGQKAQKIVPLVAVMVDNLCCQTQTGLGRRVLFMRWRQRRRSPGLWHFSPVIHQLLWALRSAKLLSTDLQRMGCTLRSCGWIKGCYS